MDTVFAGTLADIRGVNKAGANPPYAGVFVVYDLADRGCAAAASNGEYSIANGGVANYTGMSTPSANRSRLTQTCASSSSSSPIA